MRACACKMMKKVLLGVACLLAASASAYAEEEKPTADFTVGAYSKYVWRGYELSDDSIVVQPSLTVAYKGFAVNLWGNVDTDHYVTESNEFNETDLTLSYDWAMGPVGFSVGYIYYALDEEAIGEDSQEFYISASLDTILSPTLTLYRDSDTYRGTYVALDVSHSLPITDDIGLDLGAKVSYLDFDESDYDAFQDGVLSAALSIPLTDYISVAPEVYYSFPLSSDAEDELDNGEGDDSFFYGGVSVSYSF